MSIIKAGYGEIAWSRLMTSDPNSAKAFYGSLFNWDTYDLNTENLKYTIFKLGDHDIAGLLKTPMGQEEMVRPHWMSFIKVENLNATLEKAQRLGARIIPPLRTVPTLGKAGFIMDPGGAYVGFIEPEL